MTGASLEKIILTATLLALAPSLWAEYAVGPHMALDRSHLSVSVVDAESGQALGLYRQSSGQAYVVGETGRAYKVALHNRSSADILVVASIDGVNVITGKTAAPSQSGYVIPAWGQAVIDGWRKSPNEVAQFFFTPHSNSYAERTGRPNEVGIIGFAVFQRAGPAPDYGDTKSRRGENQINSMNRAPAPSSALSASLPSSGMADSARMKSRSAEPLGSPLAQESPRLGTGHGERQWSQVEYRDFVRASKRPYAVVTIEYDSLENLQAKGVIRVPGRSATAHRPNPFPADVFVPDPPTWR